MGYSRARKIQLGIENVSTRSNGYSISNSGCIIVSAANEVLTLEETLKWKAVIEDNAENGGNANIPCMLVQNKLDLINE